MFHLPTLVTLRSRRLFKRRVVTNLSAMALTLCSASGAFAGESASVQVASASMASVLPTSASAAQWTASGSYSGSDYRLSLARGALDLGLRFDLPPGTPGHHDAAQTVSGPLLQPLPAFELGLRSVSVNTPPTLREMAGAETAQATVRRVGLQWKPASELVFFRQGVGVRLSGDDRVTMRLKKGLLGLYMKQDF